MPQEFFDPGELADWLRELAKSDGITTARLRNSSLLKHAHMPDTWSQDVAVARLLDLIRDAIAQLSRANAEIAITALNLNQEIDAPTPTRRYRNLIRRLETRNAAARGDDKPEPWSGPLHVTSLAKRWKGLVGELARAITVSIDAHNRDGWGAFPIPDDATLQPFIVDRLEASYFLDKHRACREAITQRWLTAHLGPSHMPSIDHYVARARYSGVPGGNANVPTRIAPLLNCASGEAEVGLDGWVTSKMYFPNALQDGQSVFFSSRVSYDTDQPMDPVASIQVTSLGIRKLIMRVQFDPEQTPSRCWVFAGHNYSDMRKPPKPEDSSTFREPNGIGYVDYEESNCRPGWSYAICWEWDQAC